MHHEIFVNDVLDKFTARIIESSTLHDLRELLSDMTASLGYRFFGYHIIKHTALYDRSNKQPIPGISNVPKEWIEHYRENHYVKDDKVIELCRSRKTPFHWRTELKRSEMTELQQRIMDHAASAELVDGYTMPLMSRDGEIAIMTVIPDHQTYDAEKQRYNENLLYILAQFFHARALRLVMEEELATTVGRRRAFLSCRERETIFWISRGKSSWEAAQILGISEKSVECYMESVKRKLEAVNRTQAVVKALLLGLIDTDHEALGLEDQSDPAKDLGMRPVVVS
ncbi:LuxR family transcriptional regulator [Rhizobium sp.]|jgi:DNA-binding CsgD family transcriptional regulator|uniref:helix-turn-helix transcriptional regulator n=1 Tax=Rhizobium sp. TaxID=391 RepID=UPI000E929283|nr:hypothetical protein [Rhizobium sp.]